MISIVHFSMWAAASVLGMDIEQSDGHEIEAVLQSPGPSFDAPILTFPSAG
jgi:hypothetical protein